jgi:hypothetical protein
MMNGAMMPGAQSLAAAQSLAPGGGPPASAPIWFPEAIYGPKRPVRTAVDAGEPSVSIPATRGAGAEVEGQVPNVVYYVVTWDSGAGERWVSEHRYSEFHGLREQLLDVVPSEEHKSVKAMSFPKKKLFSYGQDTTDQRRQDLEKWLTKLVIGGLTKFKITPKPSGQGFPSETLVYGFLTGGGETTARPKEPAAPPPDEPQPAPAPAAVGQSRPASPAPAAVGQSRPASPAPAPAPAPAEEEDDDDDDVL